MIDFPASPTNGQVFTSGAQSWTWDGTKWVASGVAAMPPLATGDNRVINGDFRIDQRNNGASGTADGYTVDRWGFSATSGKMQWGRKLNSANDLATSGFAYSLSIATTTPYTPVGSDTFQLYQPIEADMVSDFAWGTSAAQPVTLSFWVNSTVATGSFGGVVQNYSAPHRTYPFTFSVPSANTWTKIVVVIPGDTAGTWAMSGNAGAFFLLFDLGSGPSQRGPAGAWASATYNGANGTVSPVAASGAQCVLHRRQARNRLRRHALQSQVARREHG